MDHSTANFIDYNTELLNFSVKSDFTATQKGEALGRSENSMHHKEQQMSEAFYKDIAQKILNYDHVLLFGPTNAKTELHNYLKKDLHFLNIKIDVESADKMTDNEKNAYVLNFFNGTNA